MLYVILETENLSQKNERAYKKNIQLSQGVSDPDENLVYFFDARLFLNCIENYYGIRRCKIILVDCEGQAVVFGPQEREKAIRKIQRDSEPHTLSQSSHPIEKHSSIVSAVHNYTQAASSLLAIRQMKFSTIPAPFADVADTLEPETLDERIQIAVCASYVTDALARVVANCPLADLWTWSGSKLERNGLEKRIIEFDNLVFNTGAVLPTLDPQKDKIPSQSIVLIGSELYEPVRVFLHRLNDVLDALPLPTARSLLADRDSKDSPLRLILSFAQETSRESIIEVCDVLDDALNKESIAPCIDIIQWSDYASLSCSESSATSVSSDAKHRTVELIDYTGRSSQRRGRASSSGVNPSAALPSRYQRSLLQKSTSEGEQSLLHSKLHESETPWKRRLSDTEKQRQHTVASDSRRNRKSTSPVKTRHPSDRTSSQTQETPRGVDEGVGPAIRIASREEMDTYLSDEGFKRVSPKRRRPNGPAARCRLKLYCGKQRAGVNCGYYHPREELVKLRSGRGLVPRKIYICKNDNCRFQNEPEKCSYAHSERELFCTFCESRGHHYAECPVANQDSARLPSI